MSQYIKMFDMSLIRGLCVGLEYESAEGFFCVICDLGFIRLIYAKMTPEVAIDLGFAED